ncbi:MAG TPA: tyrosine-type recombinase/integrase [Acidimicrobiia bacterium]|nr:tyrosine-type recombinase/integrase [Acidimicrobiia bacterium]
MATDGSPVPSNKGRKLPPQLLTADEVRRLIGACSRTAPTGLRNRALVVTLYRAGLRLDEALRVTPGGIDPAGGLIHLEGRAAGIDRTGLAIVGDWLRARAALGLGDESPLFCTLTGGPLHPAYVRQLLPRLAAKAGIAKRVHAQGLRHTHAAELAAEGLPVEVIQAQLGHGSLASTDRYLRRIPPRDRLASLQRREWKV